MCGFSLGKSTPVAWLTCIGATCTGSVTNSFLGAGVTGVGETDVNETVNAGAAPWTMYFTYAAIGDEAELQDYARCDLPPPSTVEETRAGAPSTPILRRPRVDFLFMATNFFTELAHGRTVVGASPAAASNFSFCLQLFPYATSKSAKISFDTVFDVFARVHLDDGCRGVVSGAAPFPLAG